ncbi:Sulfatase [Mariniblastus fucicola]|uniref:Sulfatase n=1 Tax=Mariniblastus fucicola TaxID=980251 RepID=A0A5B9PRJ9_9BACT|nr:Sulfatase [Mariniblastus fucicola]
MIRRGPKMETIAKYSPDKIAKVPGVTAQTRSVYAAMVNEMDQGIGKLLSKVDAIGFKDNTVAWFLSDYECMKRTNDNRPLRGHNGNSHEGGLRVR